MTVKKAIQKIAAYVLVHNKKMELFVRPGSQNQLGLTESKDWS
jgi:hypothetical protein